MKRYIVSGRATWQVDVDFVVKAEDEDEARRVGEMLIDEKAWDRLESGNIQPDIDVDDIELDLCCLSSLITQLIDKSVTEDEPEAGYYQILYQALEGIARIAASGEHPPIQRKELSDLMYGRMERCEDNDAMIEKCFDILKRFEPHFFEIPYTVEEGDF